MTSKPPASQREASTTPEDERHLTLADVGPLAEAQWGDTPLREDQQHLKRHLQSCEACGDEFGRMISAMRYTM
jgi:hypothetical protein